MAKRFSSLRVRKPSVTPNPSRERANIDLELSSITYARRVISRFIFRQLIPSQGEDGENGIKGHVNNHFIRVFGTAMAIGLIGSGSTIGASSPLTGGGVDQLRYGFSNGMSEGAMQVLGRNAFIEPTITLKGNKTHLQIVVIGKDLALPALEDQRVKKSL